MVFEAVGSTREDIDESLDDHMEKLESEPDVEIVEKELGETSEVEKPHPDIETGYSKVVETVIEVENFTKAVKVTINYGPTYVQLESPEKWEMDLKDGQEALQEVANTMHQYAQMGPGGVIISRQNEE
jgi:hypothetical protein